MKKILALAAFTLIAALYFGSCDLLAEKYTPRERMEAFIEDANAGRWLDLKQHTHPDASAVNAANPEFWQTFLKAGSTGSLSVTGTSGYFTSSSVDYKATLEEDEEDNYKIRRIIRTSDSHIVFE